MKKRKISISIIAFLLLSSFFVCPLSSHAQKTQILKFTQDSIPFYQGTYIGVDLFGIGNKCFGGDYFSTEISAEANLQNRFFPILEIGYGHTNKTHEETNAHYKTTAPYFRIGANYNVLYKKPHLPGQLLIGLRYGFTSFKYDVDAPDIEDNVWPGDASIPFRYEGVKSNASWAEIVIGLKSNIYRNFYMGLALRYKSRFSVKKDLHSEPWYIPGFGTNKSSNIGVTYNLIYKLPF